MALDHFRKRIVVVLDGVEHLLVHITHGSHNVATVVADNSWHGFDEYTKEVL